jgi:hypothetical protein
LEASQRETAATYITVHGRRAPVDRFVAHLRSQLNRYGVRCLMRPGPTEGRPVRRCPMVSGLRNAMQRSRSS